MSFLYFSMSIEKQAAVVEFLKDSPSGQWESLRAIWKGTSVNLKDDADLLAVVVRNARIEQQEADNGEVVLRYKYHHSIESSDGIISSLENSPDGIPRSEIISMYHAAANDVFRMIRCGDIIGIHNQERRDMILYPRKSKFLTELSGVMHPSNGNLEVRTDKDLTIEIRRGDAIRLFPKSRLVKIDDNLHDFPPITSPDLNWVRVNSCINQLPEYDVFNSGNPNSAVYDDFIDDDNDVDVIKTTKRTKKRKRLDEYSTKGGKANSSNPYANQPKSSQPRPSVSSITPLSIKNRYFYPFNSSQLPLESCMYSTQFT